MAASEIQGLHHVQLAMPAGAEDAARRFYSGTLGLSEIAKPAALAGRGGVWFRAGTVEIHLGVSADFVAAKKAHPAVLVDDLAALAERFQKAGVTTATDVPLDDFERVFAFDPFGNRLEFLERRKSTVAEIRERFDDDVERFSNLETGQTATIDAPLALELVARAAQAATPHARRLLDVGCGAGNFTLRTLQYCRLEEITLVDLSRPMLARATQRIAQVSPAQVTAIAEDIRDVKLGDGNFDLVLAGAVLHHLRSDAEWEAVFTAIYRSLAPGGSFWIFDLVTHPQAAVQEFMWRRYGEYLSRLKDDTYRDHVQAYVAREDSPRALAYQLSLLARVGFEQVDVLHYHTCFAAFGGIKPTSSA